MSNALKIIVTAILALFLIGCSSAPVSDSSAVAKCLSEKGAKFYGAFWCSHCQNQKAMFGAGAEYLPYIECSTSDRRGQLQACTDAGIESYPTWVFPDGSRTVGGMQIEALAKKTGC